MSEYTPKVGDKVRATLGENVLVGDVRYVDPGRTIIAVSDGGSWATVWHHDGWQFEQVVEVPNKPWALVGHPTDYDYVPYIRDRKGNWHEIDDAGRTLPVEEVTVRHYLGRGFTVLFEGGDE